MAEEQQNTNPNISTNTFVKGMVKDLNDTFVSEQAWNHTRNAINNSHDGDLFVIGNEPANLNCITLPYTLIGHIHLTDDQWVLFTTDNINSEIGIFDDSACTYKKVLNASCLNFKTTNLIIGAARRKYDCSRVIYWDDGLNPTRYLDLDNIPYKFSEVTVPGNSDCVVKQFTDEVDCERLRLAPIIKQPCIDIRKGSGTGTLPNGTYQACIAYTDGTVKLTDYIGLTNPQSLFSHDNVNSSLEVIIKDIDNFFDEFELVILARVNNQTVAKRVGYYNTNVGTIYVDRWDTEFETIPLSQLVLRTESIEKSDSIYNVNDYLLRIGTYSKFKFNYQPLANKIITKWNLVRYPSDYYRKGGKNVGYLRDENYTFFIRFIDNTGNRTESYVIPNREPIPGETTPLITGDDVIETGEPFYKVQNTAIVTSRIQTSLQDGGTLIASGLMGYHESTEKYPSDKPDIWGDLCGKNIRLHRIPDETVDPILSLSSEQGRYINVIGVSFENIQCPLDEKGDPISSIVGYEILRGSREGNKSIIAKGIFNNVREYFIPGNTKKGLFQNYPYNDLRPDPYLTEQPRINNKGEIDGQVNVTTPRMDKYRKDIFSFHSPDVTFSNPFLNTTELKIYNQPKGVASGYFTIPYKHPRFKVLTDFSEFVSKLTGILGAIDAISNGIEIAATNDVPISRRVGPIPPMTFDPTIVGVSSSDPTAIGYNKAAAVWNTALGITSAISTIANVAALASSVASIQKEKTFELLRLIVPKRQYAAQYNSHAFYNDYDPNPVGNRRRKIEDSNYIGNTIQQFTVDFQVNNINRSKFVCVKTTSDIQEPITQDKTRFILSETDNAKIDTAINSITSTYYGALKINIPGQYGQLQSIKQLPINNGCSFSIIPDKSLRFETSILFGGDSYIGRFTEKNSMFFFNDWLVNDPDEVIYDYSLQTNIPYPRYWLRNNPYHSSFIENASDSRSLDARESKAFHVQRGWFYLFNNGVRDFFVESEVNVDYRDWEEEPFKRHYDPYNFTDLNTMFRSDYIKYPNIYKYDYSLSVSKLVNSSVTWGNLLPNDYDPKTYNKCFVYRPSRIIYSLPQNEENKKDNWRVYLTNNYKDFSSPVTSIKSISKSGALIMMERSSPKEFIGVEELQLAESNTKITIGDGKLFSQPLKDIVNADESYEYGSCQNKYSVISTKYGIFWVSQNQGKIFQYAGQLKDISAEGMKWWFAKHLPSELLKVYPDYPYKDNPVHGIGVQVIYDNTNEIIYFTKKDFKPKRKDLLFDDNGFYEIVGYNTTIIPGQNIYSCPDGYTLQGNKCVRTEVADPIENNQTINLTRTPYHVYGSLGTRVYSAPNPLSTFTLLDIDNTFWRASVPTQTQAAQLNNGPVNRLSVWGDVGGLGLNNYNNAGADLLPINEWIGFNVCINIQNSKTYHVCVAADNNYRIVLDGTIILQGTGTSSNTTSFDYLHIYPIDIPAGNHTLTILGFNAGGQAGFGCEIFDLSSRPSNQSVVNFLNDQTDYSTLDAMTIFTTRTTTQFTSNTFSCPLGFGLTDPSCTTPQCSRLIEIPANVTIIPPKEIRTPIKRYCNWYDEGQECWEDVSWTISYDPKIQAWLSFHDWKPSFVIPSRNTFNTVDFNTIWKHNVRCDLFCNFYGKDYPFEIDFIQPSGQQVNTARSVEYLLEVYKYHNNCLDKYHVLDENFDQAIIYNSEQISGLLELNIKEKNDPLALLEYPIINSQSISIQYSKEEQKYRFNQFWDITKDRGEFNSVNVPMFISKHNGYEFDINSQYVNYDKNPLERKKFRHNTLKVFLRKLKSSNNKFLFKIFNTKKLNSPR